MHTFDYIEAPKQLLTPDIVNLLSSLHEFRGKQVSSKRLAKDEQQDM